MVGFRDALDRGPGVFFDEPSPSCPVLVGGPWKMPLCLKRLVLLDLPTRV